MALAVLNHDYFTAYNLGDSRIYRLKGERLLRITEDHTLAEERIRMGLLTPAKAEHDRSRNILTRYVGTYDDLGAMPDFYGPFKFEDNRRVLLCSDGLTGMLSHREINGIINNAPDTLSAVNELVDRSLNKGGIDNITCIVIEF